MMRLAFYIAKYGNYQDHLVSLFTWGKYSHCELVFSNGEWFSSSPRDNGTRFRTINPAPNHWDYQDIKHNKEDEQKIYEWCKKHEGKPYDYLGVLGIFTGKNCIGKERWYCSEVCLTSLIECGIIVQCGSNQVSPTGLYRIIQKYNENF